jgi:DNA-binding MarR family transcriptional regulator
VNRGRRWILDDAIEQSALAPVTRHVLHTLLRRADARTAVIPDQRLPTLGQLQAATGLRKQTMTEALKDAIDRGWLTRERGGGPGHSTRYTITIPAPIVGRQVAHFEPLIVGHPTAHNGTRRTYSEVGR